MVQAQGDGGPACLSVGYASREHMLRVQEPTLPGEKAVGTEGTGGIQM